MNPWIAKAVVLGRPTHSPPDGFGEVPILRRTIARAAELARGPSYLVTFAILDALRMRAEERMMLEEFGPEHEACMSRTKRLVPGVW